MLLTTTLSTAEDVHLVVAEVGAATYGANITADVEALGRRSRGANAGRYVYRVKLNARDSRAEGARRSGSGRRGPWTCWHAFRDVFAAWLVADPCALIRTGVQTYEGADGFLQLFPQTADRNVGSLAAPLCMGDACDCEMDAEDRKVSPSDPRPGRELRDGERDYVDELYNATR